MCPTVPKNLKAWPTGPGSGCPMVTRFEEQTHQRSHRMDMSKAIADKTTRRKTQEDCKAKAMCMLCLWSGWKPRARSHFLARAASSRIATGSDVRKTRSLPAATPDCPFRNALTNRFIRHSLGCGKGKVPGDTAPVVGPGVISKRLFRFGSG